MFFCYEFRKNAVLAGDEKSCINWGSLDSWTAVTEIVQSLCFFETQKVLNYLIFFSTTSETYLQCLVGFCNNVSLQLFSSYFGLFGPCVYWPLFVIFFSGIFPSSSASQRICFSAFKRICAYSSLLFYILTWWQIGILVQTVMPYLFGLISMVETY